MSHGMVRLANSPDMMSSGGRERAAGEVVSEAGRWLGLGEGVLKLE